jgi:hypothetical protein
MLLTLPTKISSLKSSNNRSKAVKSLKKSFYSPMLTPTLKAYPNLFTIVQLKISKKVDNQTTNQKKVMNNLTLRKVCLIETPTVWLNTSSSLTQIFKIVTKT